MMEGQHQEECVACMEVLDQLMEECSHLAVIMHRVQLMVKICKALSIIHHLYTSLARQEKLQCMEDISLLFIMWLWDNQTIMLDKITVLAILLQVQCKVLLMLLILQVILKMPEEEVLNKDSQVVLLSQLSVHHIHQQEDRLIITHIHLSMPAHNHQAMAKDNLLLDHKHQIVAKDIH